MLRSGGKCIVGVLHSSIGSLKKKKSDKKDHKWHEKNYFSLREGTSSHDHESDDKIECIDCFTTHYLVYF